MKRPQTTIILKATTLITVAALTSTFTLTQSASAKGFDFFENIRDAFDNHKSTPAPSNKSQLQQIIARGNDEINRRITTLGRLDNLIDNSVHLTSANKTTLKNQVNTELNGLNTLKAKLSGETTVAAARADVQSIYTEYRVYALVVPKIHLIKLADDVQATDTKLTELAGKLQSRIDGAKASGKDVSSIEAELTDLRAQVAAAQNIAGNVETKVIGLMSTDYNNDHKLLSGYSAQLRTARSDNQAAYKDAQNIVNVLKTY